MLKQYLPIYAELVVSCLQREAVIEQQQQQSQHALRLLSTNQDATNCCHQDWQQRNDQWLRLMSDPTCSAG